MSASVWRRKKCGVGCGGAMRWRDDWKIGVFYRTALTITRTSNVSEAPTIDIQLKWQTKRSKRKTTISSFAQQENSIRMNGRSDGLGLIHILFHCMVAVVAYFAREVNRLNVKYMRLASRKHLSNYQHQRGAAACASWHPCLCVQPSDFIIM